VLPQPIQCTLPATPSFQQESPGKDLFLATHFWQEPPPSKNLLARSSSLSVYVSKSLAVAFAILGSVDDRGTFAFGL
jgi:hypothetical protein